MEKFLINVNNLSCLYVYTDIEKVKNNFLEKMIITKTIPADVDYLGNVCNIDVKNNYILLLDSKYNSADINIDKNIANIFVDKEKLFVPDIVYLAIGMLANDLQTKGYYFVQASVVDYGDNQGIMFMGDPSAGKTSLAYNMMKKFNCSLVSNDNVLLKYSNDKLHAICGTKKMQMRLGVLKEHFPELLNEIDISKFDINQNEWDIKVYIDEYLKNQGFNYKDDTSITDIYNISTYKGYHGYVSFIKKRDAIDSLLLIYEHLTKQIRSNRYVLVSLDYPLPSFENNNYTQERYNYSKSISENIDVYDAKGSIEELTNKVYKKTIF